MTAQRVPYEPEALDDPREWVQIAILMINDGLLVKEAAADLQKSTSAIYDALHPQAARARKSRHRRSRRAGGVKCSECGNPMTYPSPNSAPICRRCRKLIGRRNDETIIRMWKAGKRAPEIAEVVGMTGQQVNGRVNNIRNYQDVNLEYRR